MEMTFVKCGRKPTQCSIRRKNGNNRMHPLMTNQAKQDMNRGNLTPKFGCRGGCYIKCEWEEISERRKKKKIHQIYQNMGPCQLSQCITAHTVTAAEQRESTSSLAVSFKTMQPSSFTAGTERDGVVWKACVSLCL